jgi:hypothetical protein
LGFSLKGIRSAPPPLPVSSDFFKSSSSSDSCLTSRSIFGGGGEALRLCLEFGFFGASLFGDTIDAERATEHNIGDRDGWYFVRLRFGSCETDRASIERKDASMALLLLDNTLCNRRLGCSSHLVSLSVLSVLSVYLLWNMCTSRLLKAGRTSHAYRTRGFVRRTHSKSTHTAIAKRSRSAILLISLDVLDVGMEEREIFV